MDELLLEKEIPRSENKKEIKNEIENQDIQMISEEIFELAAPVSSSGTEVENQEASDAVDLGLPVDLSSEAAAAVEELDLKDPQLMEEIAKIPSKMAFKIGEVADLVGLKTYVLRYWETEFDALRPQKSRHNQRVYSRKDVETVLLIQKLLYRDRFSIEGARKALRRLKGQVREEKKWEQVVQRFDTLADQVEDLIDDIHGLRRLFS